MSYCFCTAFGWQIEPEHTDKAKSNTGEFLIICPNSSTRMLISVRSGKQIWEMKELFPPQSSIQAEAQLSFALIEHWMGLRQWLLLFGELKTKTVWYNYRY